MRFSAPLHFQSLKAIENGDASVRRGNSELIRVSLSKLIQKHFSGRPVIYISDRVNSYSLDPVATANLIHRNNIRFAGVITYTDQQRSLYPYEERIFQGITMCSFDSLAAAVSWAEQKSRALRDLGTIKSAR